MSNAPELGSIPEIILGIPATVVVLGTTMVGTTGPYSCHCPCHGPWSSRSCYACWQGTYQSLPAPKVVVDFLPHACTFGRWILEILATLSVWSDALVLPKVLVVTPKKPRSVV